MPSDKERRIDIYTFSSERELIDFFSTSLPRKDIKQVLKDTKKRFVRRNPGTAPEERLQYLKKAEIELVRLSRERLGVSESER